MRKTQIVANRKSAWLPDPLRIRRSMLNAGSRFFAALEGLLAGFFCVLPHQEANEPWNLIDSTDNC
jgi:hypothetical protein